MRILAFLAIAGLLAIGGVALAQQEGRAQQVDQPAAKPVNHPRSVTASNGAPVSSNGRIAYGIGVLESTWPGGPSSPLGTGVGNGGGRG